MTCDVVHCWHNHNPGYSCCDCGETADVVGYVA